MEGSVPYGTPRQCKATRAVTLISTAISTNSWTQERVESPDVVVVNVRAVGVRLRIYNIYNDCKHDKSLEVLDRDLRRSGAWRRGGRGVSEGMIWAGDFNRHHPLWDEERNHHLFTTSNLKAAQKLLDLTAAYNMIMMLPKDMATLEASSTKNRTRVDNVFCSAEIVDRMWTCTTREEERVTRTDHFPVETAIGVRYEQAKIQRHPNFRRTDWEQFRDKLTTKLNTIERPREFRRGEVAAFLKAKEELERVLGETIEEVVPKTKMAPWKKRWWTRELQEKRGEVRRLAVEVKGLRDGEGAELRERYRRRRNDYAQMIRREKKAH
ncbi:hypothetical protein CVT24_012139 [Panaeolus cyanescens]|uniref:Endonuclease/exonuclease/phosphatase domain-containing protein n=1 Tax=Panaeolus cyanescens TaxID=181874 RepID=A0A409YYR1_9AGAR|nr:hypothetical protein CVT24_012139 [Panaeolus cyanescens]